MAVESPLLKVLIVDDEPDVLVLLEGLLQRHFEVSTAGDGESALELLRQHEFVAVLADQMMPGLTGVELLAKVCHLQPRAARILFTASNDIDHVTDAVNIARVHRLVRKPLHMIEFRNTVEAAVAEVTQDRAGSELTVDLLRALDTTIGESRVSFVYQPIVDGNDRSIFGYEALCRPSDEAFEGPEKLFETAERAGRVTDLGRACRNVSTQAIDSMDPERLMFVNLHPYEINESLVVEAEGPLQRYSNRLVFEITETASITNYARLRRLIDSLRNSGFRVALDDLGTGHSGLNALARIAPDFVKLDMSLVRGLQKDTGSSRLVSHLIDFSRGESIQVIAEGVETEEERDALLDTGCQLMQGFLFARPGEPFPKIES